MATNRMVDDEGYWNKSTGGFDFEDNDESGEEVRSAILIDA